jgi:predicted peroxiredoxin
VKRLKDEKFILYVQTSDEPERQYSPLVILLPGAAEKIKIGAFPSVAEMLQKTLKMGIEIYVCEASKQMLGWEKVDLIPGVKIVGAATLNDLALDASATMWF